MGAEAEKDACVSQPLLHATMCVIGLPVDAHIRDGSVYSGIFHTASLEQGYGIVLKEARLTKKGTCKANIANGSVIETLVVFSGDLVQVIAKGVLFSADRDKGNAYDLDVQSPTSDVPSSEIFMSEGNKSNNSMYKRKIHQSRGPAESKNNSTHRCMPTKAGKEHEGRDMPLNHVGNVMEVEHEKPDESDEASGASVNERKTGDDWLQLGQDSHKEKFEFQREKSTDQVQSSTSILGYCLTQAKPVEEGQVMMKLLPNGASCGTAFELYTLDTECYERPACVDASSPISTASSPVLESATESHFSPLSALTDAVALQHVESNMGSKEFRLNPEAKSFSPSLSSPPSNTPGVLPVAGMAYVPSSSPTVPVATRPFIPAKFAPYSNVTVGNGSDGSQFFQPIIGHVGSKTQPVRYVSQYHAVQSAPAYVPPNPQTAVVGRPGQHVYVYPVPHDLAQTAAVSPVSAHPLLTQHQIHYPHQGSGAGQPLQLCVPQAYVAGGQQPFAVPSQFPLLQVPIPPHQPNPVPGPNAFYRNKIP